MSQWTFIKKVREELIEAHGAICAYCGEPAKEASDFHIDHVLPKSKSGKTIRENLVLACPKCNARKNAFLLREWELRKEKRLKDTLEEVDYLQRSLNGIKQMRRKGFE